MMYVFFRWVGGVPLKPRSFHVMFHPNGSPRQQLRLASRPLLYLVFWVLPGGWGWDFDRMEMKISRRKCLDPKKYTPWMIVPNGAWWVGFSFLAFFYHRIFLRRHFNLMKQHLWMHMSIFVKITITWIWLLKCQIQSWAHFHQLGGIC